MHRSGNHCLMEPLPSPLSSRPERSGGDGSAVRPSVVPHFQPYNPLLFVIPSINRKVLSRAKECVAVAVSNSLAMSLET